LLAADLEVFDESPGIWEDGGEGDGLGEANNCLRQLASIDRFQERGRLPSRKSWRVGKSSGSRRYLCLVRIIASPLGKSLTTSATHLTINYNRSSSVPFPAC
jgi:hypothetical protein